MKFLRIGLLSPEQRETLKDRFITATKEHFSDEKLLTSMIEEGLEKAECQKIGPGDVLHLNLQLELSDIYEFIMGESNDKETT